LLRALRGRGAPDTCWVLSEVPGLDGVQLPLSVALDRVCDGGWEASVVSCLPGQLAYYHDEDEGSWLILERAGSL